MREAWHQQEEHARSVAARASQKFQDHVKRSIKSVSEVPRTEAWHQQEEHARSVEAKNI